MLKNESTTTRMPLFLPHIFTKNFVLQIVFFIKPYLKYHFLRFIEHN